MTIERDFDRIARAWLDLGPNEAPDRSVAAVLQAIETTPQVRRPIRLVRRGLAIGIDIGGTKVAAGVVDGQGRVLAEEIRETPGHDPREVEHVIVSLVQALSAQHRILSVGIGAAGWPEIACTRAGTVLLWPTTRAVLPAGRPRRSRARSAA